MNIINLIDSIRERPMQYIKNKTIYDLDAFLSGYNFHDRVLKREKHGHMKNSEEQDYFEEFQFNWINEKLKIDKRYHYVQCLLLVSNNPEDAYENFFVYWDKYREESYNIC